MSSPRIGVFGGTFNPVHLGHLRAAEEVAEQLQLSRVVFVPCAQPPHKRDLGEDTIAPPELRLAWLGEAVRGNPRFEVDPLEIERGGRSYSVDTLRVWSERCAPERPFFLIGHDAFLLMDSWREPEEIFRLADFAVIARPPLSRGRLADWLPKCVRDDAIVAADGCSALHGSAGTRIVVLEIAALDISASDVRARLRNGRSVRYLLPDAVEREVRLSGVYAAR